LVGAAIPNLVSPHTNLIGRIFKFDEDFVELEHIDITDGTVASRKNVVHNLAATQMGMCWLQSCTICQALGERISPVAWRMAGLSS
jgi:hypothetical protein